MIWKLAFISIAIYAGISISLYLFQDRLVFFPDRNLAATPRDIGLDYEDVWLTTSDGVRIHGWYVPAAGAGATIVFLHGNAGNISHRLDTLRIFHRLHVNTLIIDYRGYGQSDGSPSEPGSYLDARAAWDYLTEVRKLPPQTLIIFGRSLGGAVAAWLAKEVEPGGVVLESTFSSVPDMAVRLYPWLPVRLLARIRYDTRTYLLEVNCPVLVVHSEEDDLIPFSHGETLYAVAGQPKSFLRMRGGHNNGFLVSGDAYVQGLAAFLRATRAPTVAETTAARGQ